MRYDLAILLIKEKNMKATLKELSCILGITMILTTISSVFPFTVKANEQTLDINGLVYEFGEKSEYNIDSSTPSGNADSELNLGTLSISGDIQKTYDKNGITAYEIADDKIFSLDFKYISSLKNAGKDSWHLIKDNKNTVNGVELDKDVDYGALILQTSLDGQSWIENRSFTNFTGDKSFGADQINDIQLANGCYYRVIAAYKAEKRTKDNKVFDDYATKKIAQVYEFYASYKTIDTAPTGEKFYFYAGAKNSEYTKKTKKNNYAGSEGIDKKDPHYGWDLGYFCLSGYTDKGDSEDVYLKKVGNKVKLTFHLDQNIKKLNGNGDLKIAVDKDGSDENFKVSSHNMKHGELIIHYTDSENVTEEAKYSDYLAALASPGADTSIQLFEEGDYEVHLNYAITDYDGINSTTYYQTSFKFKIRNANTMVYIFDSKSGAELSNGDVTENGFRIDTAKSSYPKLQVKKEILNNTESGLVEDTRFNGAAADGEIFTDEGIYTVKAYNRYDDKLEPAVKTIYVGSNNILTAYTRHLNSPEQYTIAQLNSMVEDGYTITDDGEIIEPVSTVITTSTNIITTTMSTTTTTTTYTTTSVTTTAAVSAKKSEKKGRSALPFVIGGCVGAAAIGGMIVAVLKKRKNNEQETGYEKSIEKE